ncbi:predicted protein [Aspergillus terreus NIH2624]|uniref:Uncharacterized protein n=1 Tax=Aspergillus terreus (strain NIH 2624 / FGSC A1156) TaxID=341663 RepID=Q0CPS5_ASPTN|nr:uncharacterized protein ATEG_04309 [Aspergillus terreus NIH2624]EAU34756.1 predicted protein [Aspergillus terreus NIH2624]
MAARTAAAQTPVDPNSVIIDRSLFGSTEVHIKHSAMSHEVHLILATFFVNRLGNHSKRPDVRVSSSASSSKAKQEMNRRPTSQAEGPASELRKKGRASHPAIDATESCTDTTLRDLVAVGPRASGSSLILLVFWLINGPTGPGPVGTDEGLVEALLNSPSGRSRHMAFSGSGNHGDGENHAYSNAAAQRTVNIRD